MAPASSELLEPPRRPLGEQLQKRLLEGTHRVREARETLASLLPLLGEFEITRVANITGLDDIGIPTVVVARPNARSLSVSQGKGVSLEAAKVSAIMESLEQWHAEQVGWPVALGSYAQRRRRGNVVDVARLPRTRRDFDVDARLLWVSGVSQVSGAVVEVPHEMVHLDLTQPLPEGSGFFPLGSNGLASGNTLAESIAHGAWELIERDALALFFRLPMEAQSARRIELRTVDDGVALALLERYEAAGVGVALWDVTSDVGVPAFLCDIVEREANPFRRVGVARGSGCHPDRGVALCRALTEAAQSRLTRITGSRDDLQSEEFELLRSTSEVRRHQLVLSGSGSADFRRVETHTFATFERDLEWTVARLAAVGADDLVFVDLSHADLPVSVVRVVIPGLEGDAAVPGYRPGRRARAVREERAH